MSQQDWFMAIGGHQVGPVTRDDVVTNLRNGTVDGNTLVFKAGMSNWTPLKDVPELAAYLSGAAASPAGAPPPLVPGRRAHDIDFTHPRQRDAVRRSRARPWRKRRRRGRLDDVHDAVDRDGDGVRRRLAAVALGRA